MKKTKILEALLAGALALLVSGFTFTSCSNAAGNDDNGSGSGGSQSGRTKVEGKIGEYGYPYEVGDIVFKDGSAIPYSNGLELEDTQKADAIAIIFYKGNQLNSDDEEGNAVTDKERILGVGLSQSHSNMGNYWGSGYGATRDMTSIKCSVRGEKGNWVISGDKDGHDNLYQMAVELKSDNDIYATVDSYYAAFLFALHYAEKTTNQLKNTSYEKGWYLPSIAELYYLWKEVDVVNKASKLCGGENFGDSENIAMQEYWSSSKSTTEAEIYTFSFDRRDNKLFDCEIDSVKRDSFIRNLCAIRDFTEGATVPEIPRPSAREDQLGKYGKPYEINDILLNDGSVIPYEKGLVLTAEQKEAVEAIIFYAGKSKFDETSAFKTVLGIGLEESSGKLKWCTEDAVGYSKEISYLECEVNGEPGAHTFSQDVEGKDNFGWLVNQCSTDKKSLEAKYPAMSFGGPDNPELTGNYTSIPNYWYLPTIAEMFYVWKVKDLINPALELCGGDRLKADESYWSSSVPDNWDLRYDAFCIDMSKGECSYKDKTEEKYARRIRIY